LYDRFNELLRSHGVKVETGIFGAMMQVSFTNDGPVTLIPGKPGERAHPGVGARGAAQFPLRCRLPVGMVPGGISSVSCLVPQTAGDFADKRGRDQVSCIGLIC